MRGCLLALFSLLLCLLVLEAAVRIFHLDPAVMTQIGDFRYIDDPDLVYELIPGKIVDGSPINRQGFRGGDFKVAKPKEIVRIAMLGDSITQGLGVLLEETFSKRLESLLNQRAGAINSRFKYEVMNFGVSGYNLSTEWATLKDKALVYQPDIVVFNIFHNDGEPLPLGCFLTPEVSLTDFQKGIILKKYYPWPSDPMWMRYFRKCLYKSKLFLFILGRISDFKTSVRLYVQEHYNVVLTDGEKDNFDKYIKKIKELQNTKKFKLMACLHPHLLYGVHPNNEKFARILTRYGIPYFDMVDYYRRENISPSAIQRAEDLKDHCHPNALGHEIVAKAMMAELLKRHFLDVTPSG